MLAVNNVGLMGSSTVSQAKVRRVNREAREGFHQNTQDLRRRGRRETETLCRRASSSILLTNIGCLLTYILDSIRQVASVSDISWRV
jgi:hypothetical protein